MFIGVIDSSPLSVLTFFSFLRSNPLTSLANDFLKRTTGLFFRSASFNGSAEDLYSSHSTWENVFDLEKVLKAYLFLKTTFANSAAPLPSIL